MTKRELPLSAHLLLLLVFAALAICIWMLPVSLMGYPLRFPELSVTRAFLETGVLPDGDGRLSSLLFALIAQCISFGGFMTWTLVSAIIFAVSLFPWWLAAFRSFGARVAWISASFLSFLPVYVLEATALNFYSFAFLFLFTGFACFAWLHQKRFVLALALTGFCFGLAAGAKEVFLVLMPWMLLAPLTHTSQWKTRIAHTLLFSACIGVGYIAPIASFALHDDMRPMEVLQELSPLGRTDLSPYEYYPDPYTYEFDREWYDEKMIAERGSESSYLATRDLHRRITFDVGASGVAKSLVAGLWLLVHNLLEYIHLDTVGGTVMWLCILLGAVHLFWKRKRFFLFCLGLVLSMELIVRFGLQFQRSHVQTIGWMFVLFAAIGVTEIVDGLITHLSTYRKTRVLPGVVTAVIALLLTVHLLQVDRAVLARQYMRGESLQAVSDAQLLSQIPEDALVATHHGGSEGMLSDRDQINFQEATIERLLDQYKLREAFDHYGVTHINRYPQELSNRIVQQSNVSVVTVSEDEVSAPPPSEWMRYLLRIIQ